MNGGSDSMCRLGQLPTADDIAIKNIGTTKAQMKTIERFARSMLAVYVPENVDMIDKKTKSESLDVFDQESITFEVGKGIAKRGRFFGSPPTRVSTANLPQTVSGRTAAIQKALNDLGHDAGSVDGIVGRQTRQAISRYQRSIDARATGTLTNNQTSRLLGQAGVEAPNTTGPTGGAQGRTVVTLFAAVDPYNLVAESNESNNIVKFTVEIDCSQ